MKYSLYSTSIRAWDAMLMAIDQAKKSIYLEMYIFIDDTGKNHDFIGKLKRKASEGVRVVIVADAFGSKELRKETVKEIRETGVELIFFSHWLRHIHRKVLIVDEKIAFIGGVNIGKRFAQWNDLQLKVRGRITKTFLKSFAYTYKMAGGKDIRILNYSKRKLATKLRFWLIEHWPAKNIHTLKNHYIEKISQAKSSIQITTPYFTPPRWLISLLDDAIRRGISVEVIIPEESDLSIINRLNYRYMYNLHQLGIRFFLTKEMNHSKLLIIDGEEGLIGSQNLDLLSFRINSEVGIFFRDRRIMRDLGKIIDQWKADSIKFEPAKYKMQTIDWILLTLLKIFKPIL